MRNNRLSLAYLLTLILIICAFAGQQLVFAQGKKPVFQPDCDTPVAKPAPQRFPPTARPSPSPVRGSIFGPLPPTQNPPKASDRPWELPPIPQPPYREPITTPYPPSSAPIGQPPPASDIFQIPGSTTAIEQEAKDYRVIDNISVACAELLETQTKLTLTSFSASGHNIPIVAFRGLGVRPSLYYTNSIYVHGSNAATPQELTRLIKIYKSFIEALGPDLLADPSLRNARFITTAKIGSSEFVTVFEVRDGKFGGIVLKLNAPAAHCETDGCTMTDVFESAIGPWLAPISGSGRLYMIGDDLERVDPTKLALRFNCDVIRRNDRITKNIKDTEVRLAQLQDRKLEDAKTVYINGLPRNEAEAVRAGYQRNEVRGLQNVGLNLDELAKQFFNQRTLPSFLPQDLQELFTKGESDVVLIVAHSDKERIYINGTPVSIDEIKNYPARVTPSSRPRVVILLSCYGGNFRIEKGPWLLKRSIDSLAEVLVSKGYFDKVIAPRDEITPNQVTLILRDYFNGRLIRDIATEHYQQLLQIAEMRRGMRWSVY